MATWFGREDHIERKNKKTIYYDPHLFLVYYVASGHQNGWAALIYDVILIQ